MSLVPDPRPMAPVFVTPSALVKLRNVAVAAAPPDGHARKNPLPSGATDDTDASTAAAATGIPQPFALPPCAANPAPEPDTWNARCSPDPKIPPPPRVSTTRHGATGTNTDPSAPSGRSSGWMK